MPHRGKLRIIVLFAALLLVQWFVANIAMSISSTAHYRSELAKLLDGLRTAVFAELLNHEAALFVTIGMLLIPALVGFEYLGGVLVRRIKHPRDAAVGGFPHRQLLMSNWVWIIYWPVWLMFYYHQESFHLSGLTTMIVVFYGGTIIFPPLAALAIGAYVGWTTLNLRGFPIIIKKTD